MNAELDIKNIDKLYCNKNTVFSYEGFKFSSLEYLLSQIASMPTEDRANQILRTTDGKFIRMNLVRIDIVDNSAPGFVLKSCRWKNPIYAKRYLSKLAKVRHILLNPNLDEILMEYFGFAYRSTIAKGEDWIGYYCVFDYDLLYNNITPDIGIYKTSALNELVRVLGPFDIVKNHNFAMENDMYFSYAIDRFEESKHTEYLNYIGEAEYSLPIGTLLEKVGEIDISKIGVFDSITRAILLALCSYFNI